MTFLNWQDALLLDRRKYKKLMRKQLSKMKLFVTYQKTK